MRLSKDTLVVPALPPVVQRLVWALKARRSSTRGLPWDFWGTLYFISSSDVSNGLTNFKVTVGCPPETPFFDAISRSCI